MKFLLLFLFLLSTLTLHAQKRILLDTSRIAVRTFDNKELQELKNDSDFQYERLLQPSPNLWKRFWRWFWWQINEMMRTKSGRGTVYTTLIILAGSVIIFFVLRVMGMNKSSLLSRKSNDSLPFTISSEDINSISFEDAIRDAVQSRNFRLAIRLLYLNSLKELSDKGYIQWQVNKTNSDFLKELSGKPWQSLFRKLTYTFELAWYGEKNIGKEEFEDLNLQFQQFNNQLR